MISSHSSFFLSSLAHHRLSAVIDDVGSHDEDQDREDALQRVFAVRQSIGQHHADEPAQDAAGDELAGDPPIDQTGQRVVDRRGEPRSCPLPAARSPLP
jgi:hypothetical protein